MTQRAAIVVLLLATIFVNSEACFSKSPIICQQSLVDCQDIDLRKDRIKVLSNTPHRFLNPNGKVSEFEGVAIAPLLVAGGNSLNGQDVAIIGDDGYTISIPFKLIKDHKIIIADTKDGVPLNQRSGGVQIIWPTEEKGVALPPDRFLKKAAFWVWYVNRIVVGDLKHRLKVLDKELTPKPEFLSKSQSEYKAPPIFSFEKIPCPPVFTWVIDKQLKNNGKNVGEIRSFRNSAHMIVNFNIDDFYVLTTNTQGSIPLQCGGPYILHPRSPSGTTYYGVIELLAGDTSKAERK
jgi:hypothetical protein